MESIHIPCENQSAIKVEKINFYSVVISGKGSRVWNWGHEDLLITPDPLITQVCTNQNGPWPPCSRATNSSMRSILKVCIPEGRACLLSFFSCGVQVLVCVVVRWGNMKLCITHFGRNRKTQRWFHFKESNGQNLVRGGERLWVHLEDKEIEWQIWQEGKAECVVGSRKYSGQNRHCYRSHDLQKSNTFLGKYQPWAWSTRWYSSASELYDEGAAFVFLEPTQRWTQSYEASPTNPLIHSLSAFWFKPQIMNMFRRLFAN